MQTTLKGICEYFVKIAALGMEICQGVMKKVLQLLLLF